MLFEVVRGVGRGMGVLDWGGDRWRGMGSFGGEFGASHCNQWGMCDALFSNYFEDLSFTTMLGASRLHDGLCHFPVTNDYRLSKVRSL